jgi:hypothetical protein
MCDDAPVSKYYSAACGPDGGTSVVASVASMAWWFQTSEDEATGGTLIGVAGGPAKYA